MDAEQRDALALVPQVMAEVYRVLPLRYENGILTIATAVDFQDALDDLKNLLSLKRVDGVVWEEETIRRGIAELYTGEEFDLGDWLGRPEDGHR